jgi:hypothetical protein
MAVHYSAYLKDGPVGGEERVKMMLLFLPGNLDLSGLLFLEVVLDRQHRICTPFSI